LITSFLYSVTIVICFKRNVLWALLFFVSFGLIDANFLAANLTKFVTGGWFSVVVTLIITSILLVWRVGRFAMVEQQRKLNMPLDLLYAPREQFDDTGSLKQIIHPVDVSTPLLICFSSTTDMIPAAFYHFSQRLPVRPRNLVFVTVQAVNVAFVEPELKLQDVEGHHNVYRLVIQHGYCERSPSARKLAAYIIRELDCAPDMVNYFPPPTDAELVRFVNPTFVIGRDRVVAKKNAGFFHTVAVEMFQVLYFFSRPAAILLAIPADSALEVGMQIPI